MFRTRGHKWLKVINRLGSDEKLSPPLWEVMKLTFPINTSRIRDRAIRTNARQKYLYVSSLPDGELRKEINYLTHKYRGETPQQFDFSDYLAQKLSIVTGHLNVQGKKDEVSIKIQKSIKKSILEKDIIEKILIVMEWLHRNPAN